MFYPLYSVFVKYLRFGDVFIAFIFILLIVASVLISAGEKSGEPYAEVKESQETYLIPLSADEELHLKGPVGNTIVNVSEGAVRVTDSDCREKICIAMGDVSAISGWIACLPNRVFIQVIGSTGDGGNPEVDAGAF